MSLFRILGGLPKEKIKTFLSLHNANHDSDSSDDGKGELDEKYYANKPPPIADDQLLANVVCLPNFANLINLSKKNVETSRLRPTVDGIKTSNFYEVLQDHESEDDCMVKENDTENICSNKIKAPSAKKFRKIKKEKKPKKIKTKNRMSAKKYVPVFTDEHLVAAYCSHLSTSSSTGYAPQSVLLNFPCRRYWRDENSNFSDDIKLNFLGNIIMNFQTVNPLMKTSTALTVKLPVDMPFFDFYTLLLISQELFLLIGRGNRIKHFKFK